MGVMRLLLSCLFQVNKATHKYETKYACINTLFEVLGPSALPLLKIKKARKCMLVSVDYFV